MSDEKLITCIKKSKIYKSYRKFLYITFNKNNEDSLKGFFKNLSKVRDSVHETYIKYGTHYTPTHNITVISIIWLQEKYTAVHFLLFVSESTILLLCVIFVSVFVDHSTF